MSQDRTEEIGRVHRWALIACSTEWSQLLVRLAPAVAAYMVAIYVMHATILYAWLAQVGVWLAVALATPSPRRARQRLGR